MLLATEKEDTMELKNKKGLFIAYVEGFILASMISLTGYWKGYSIDLSGILFFFAITPFFYLFIDKLTPGTTPFSVSFTVGVMGGMTIMVLLPGFWNSILWGLISIPLFWFILNQINNGLFPREHEQKK